MTAYFLILKGRDEYDIKYTGTCENIVGAKNVTKQICDNLKLNGYYGNYTVYIPTSDFRGNFILHRKIKKK